MLGDPLEGALEVEALKVARHLVEVLEGIGAELYRIRVAVEVLAGDALDRDLEGPLAHPAGSMRERAVTELRHLGRLEDLRDPERDPDPYGTST